MPSCRFTGMCFALNRSVKIRNLSRSAVSFGEREIPPFGTLTISYAEYFLHAADIGVGGLPISVQVEGSGMQDVSVSDFGAIGDGVVDDTYAIQSAIDYVAFGGGGTVHIPIGVYNVRTLHISSGISLSGESKTNTVLRSIDSSGVVLAVEGAIASVSMLRMVV